MSKIETSAPFNLANHPKILPLFFQTKSTGHRFQPGFFLEGFWDLRWDLGEPYGLLATWNDTSQPDVAKLGETPF